MTDSSSKSAEGEVDELTRADVLHWLQQDRSWGVLIAPTEWRAIDEEWLDLIHRAVMAHRVSPNRDRYKPQAPPAEGEVAELVRWLRDKGRGAWPPPDGLSPSAQADEYEFYSGLTRAAAPVPVPVSDRPWEREGWCDMDGECWWCPPDGPAYWSMVNPAMVYGGWLLPHWAIHQPPQGGEVEA